MSYRARQSFQAAMPDGTERTIIRGQIVDVDDEVVVGRVGWFDEVPDQAPANPAERVFVAGERDPLDFVEGEPELGRPEWEDPTNRDTTDPNADTGLHKPVDGDDEWTPTVATEPADDAVVPGDVTSEGILTWVTSNGRGPADRDGVRRRLVAARDAERAKAEPDAELLEALDEVELVLDEADERDRQASAWPDSEGLPPQPVEPKLPGGEGAPEQPTPDPDGTPDLAEREGESSHDVTTDGPDADALAPVGFEAGDPDATVDGEAADVVSVDPAPQPKVVAKKVAAKKSAPRRP